MAERTPQTLANHTRFDPTFHFFLVPLAMALFFSAVGYAVRHPDFVTVWMAFAGAAIVVAVFLTRIYSLKVQDRVIRLEERLRLQSLLSESQRSRVASLTERQLVALRFASDAELPALALRVVDEQLAPKDIKKAIRNWRPDYWRV